MGAGDCCAKLIIVLVNVIFMIIGLVLAAAGGVLIGGRAFVEPYLESFLGSLNSVSETASLSNQTSVVTDTVSTVSDLLDLFQDVAIALIALGLGILIITILAMCGSCCSVKCMLIAYVVIVLVVFLAHAIIFACLMFGVFGGHIKGALVTAIEKEYGGISSTAPHSLLLNFLMIRYECCGVYGYKDFDKAEKWERTQTFTTSGGERTFTLVTPIACCVTEGEFPDVEPVDDECSYKPTDAINNWKKGCWESLDVNLVSPNKNIVIGVNCGILVFELILAALTIFVLVMKDKSKISPI